MTYRPLHSKVLIEIDMPDEVSAGGIIVPDSAKEAPTTGVVVAIGPGKVLEDGKRHEMSVRPGQTVLFSRYGGERTTLDGINYLIVDESSIYVVIKEAS